MEKTIAEALQDRDIVSISDVLWEEVGGITTAPDKCEWFALCARVAEYLRNHPIIGMVPVCEEHAVFGLESHNQWADKGYTRG